jgi:hypothetical protein
VTLFWGSPCVVLFCSFTVAFRARLSHPQPKNESSSDRAEQWPRACPGRRRRPALPHVNLLHRSVCWVFRPELGSRFRRAEAFNAEMVDMLNALESENDGVFGSLGRCAEVAPVIDSAPDPVGFRGVSLESHAGTVPSWSSRMQHAGSGFVRTPRSASQRGVKRSSLADRRRRLRSSDSLWKPPASSAGSSPTERACRSRASPPLGRGSRGAALGVQVPPLATALQRVRCYPPCAHDAGGRPQARATGRGVRRGGLTCGSGQRPCLATAELAPIHGKVGAEPRRHSRFAFDARGSSAASFTKDHHGGLPCRPHHPTHRARFGRSEARVPGPRRAAGCCLPLRVARSCPGRRASRAGLRAHAARALPFRRMEARPNQAARLGSPASLAADARGGGASLSPCQAQWADALGPVRPQPLRQTIGTEAPNPHPKL